MESNNKENNYNFNHEQFAFFKSIVDNVPDMIFVKDAKELRFVLFNKAGEELLGYPKEDMIGKNDYDFFPKDEADFFVAKDRATLNGKIMLNIPEEPIQTKYKGARILHTKKIPILNEEGEPAYLLGISDDITERKNLEKKMIESESEKVFKILFDSAIDGLVLVDIETKKFIMANKAWYTQLGYSSEEITKLGVLDIHPKEDLPYVLDQFERQAKGEFSLAKDIPVKRKDNSVYYADINANTFKFGNKNVQLGIFRDITERKKMEQILYERERQLDALNNNLPDSAVFQVTGDAQGNRRFIYISKAIERILGVKAEAVMADANLIYSRIPKSYKEKAIGAELAAGRSMSIFEIEAPHELPNGTVRWLHICSKPRIREDGLLIFDGIATDITERKQEQELVEKTNKLMAGRELKMVELKKEIEDLKKQLKQK